MSDPPTTFTPVPVPPPPNLPLIPGGATSTTATSSYHIREYRKGNWTLQETLILITAKKLDEERRVKPSSSTTPSSPCKTGTELRWKWVENYCWSQGCFRSQNQCNDKWDNLLRDYKKVREYESKSKSDGSNETTTPSYWKLDKHERKDRNLPSNMVFEVFQGLNQVLQRKHYSQTNTGLLTGQPQPLLSPAPVTFCPPPPPPPPPPTTVAPSVSEKSADTSEKHGGSDSKRRKKVKSVGSSIMRGASVLAQTLRNLEEKKEQRHREVMELEQRRLQIEENRNDVNQQGMTNLVAAMTNLSSAIQSLISSGQNHT